MCGIYMTNIPFSRDEIENKLNHVRYRGPDNLGILKKENITLGHVRLAIVDLDERSNQPYSYEHYCITFNGEIYNFLEIKKELEALGYTFTTTSDTEVLIKGYAAWGEKVLSRLNGMFAFAILDSKKNEVFCARDRLGVKPFYYYWKDGNFEICSQLQPMLNDSSELSQEAISIYLDCGYVPSPFSIIKDIYKLQAGKFLVVDLESKTKSIKEYWNLQKVETLDISYEDAKAELHNLLIDAVKIRMLADVPLGTFLSGGIDSALVTAIVAKYSDNKINTFTIGFEDPEYDESKIAEQFAKILGTNHTTTTCAPQQILELLPKLFEVYDEPFADDSALPSLLLNKVTKNYVTVALSGDGGDESFLGYNHFDTVLKYKRLERIPYVLRKGLSMMLPKNNKYKSIFDLKSHYDFIERIFISDQLLNKNKSKSWIDKYYSDYRSLSNNALQQAADLNIKLWLDNDSNVKVDRASMAYSMEIRSPFLDYRIVEYARKLPTEYKLKDGRRKRITKDILKEYIDESVFEQPKRGFSIPVGDWLRNELKQEFQEVVNDDFLRSIDNLDVKACKRIIRQHFNNTADNSAFLWRLFVLGHWKRKFKDRKVF